MKKGKLINASLLAIMALLGISSCGCESNEPTFREKLNAYLKKDLLRTSEHVQSVRTAKFSQLNEAILG